MSKKDEATSDEVDCTIYRRPWEVEEEIITKELAQGTTSSAAAVLRRPVQFKAIFKEDGDLGDIERQIIPKKTFKNFCCNVDTEKTELKIGGSKFSMNGSLETKYIKEDDYFEHTIIISQKDEFPESVCYGQMELRNGDGLLTVDGTEVSYKPHKKVLHLLFTSCKNATDDGGDELTLEYVRPKEHAITERKYNVRSVYNEITITPTSKLSTSPDRWQKCHDNFVAYFKMIINDTYMQTNDDDIVFKKWITLRAELKLEDFHRGHFLEERLLKKGKRYFIKRFMSKKREKYLHTSGKGHLELADSFSEFRIKHVDDYCTMEYDGQLLSARNSQGVFIKHPSNEKYVPMDCRLDYSRVKCDL